MGHFGGDIIGGTLCPDTLSAPLEISFLSGHTMSIDFTNGIGGIGEMTEPLGWNESVLSK